MHVSWTLAAAALILSAPDPQPPCAMTTAASGETIYASAHGTPALLFRSNMDVNTDGTARSYHPDDPRGRTKAFNNVGNAITGLFDANGRSIGCEPRRGPCFERYISVFEEARDAKWDRVGHRYFTTKGIIPWKVDPVIGRLAPCTTSGGYLVSQTSRKLDPSKEDCDQSAYIDSFTMNGIVLPGRVRWASQGVVADEFDLVVTRNRQNGEIRYAVVGDRGPPTKLGEGTIALTAALGRRRVAADATYPEIKQLALRDVEYVIFPTFDAVRLAGGPVTQTRIDEIGARAFTQWGGVARLDACRAAPR